MKRRLIGAGASVLAAVSVGAWVVFAGNDAAAQSGNASYCVVYENRDGMVVEEISAEGFAYVNDAVVFFDDGEDVAIFMDVATAQKRLC